MARLQSSLLPLCRPVGSGSFDKEKRREFTALSMCRCCCIFHCRLTAGAEEVDGQRLRCCLTIIQLPKKWAADFAPTPGLALIPVSQNWHDA